MKKGIKVLLMVALILLLLPLFYTMIGTQAWGQLPFTLLPMSSYPLVGGLLDQLLFWLSVAFILFTVILMLVVIFYPKDRNQLEIEKDQGSLKIQKKAIESYVLEAVKEEPFIADPSVKVKIIKDKVKVQVKGQMRKVFQVTDKQERLAKKISSDISRLIGDGGKVVTDVSFKDYRKEKGRVPEARVQ